jgi:hypothetical protein
MVSANLEQIKNGWIVETADPFKIETTYFKTLVEAITFIDQFAKAWDGVD